MRATVVITTKNRKEELRVAVRSALKQTEPVEVLVIDDGSTDGTSEMIRAEFPQVVLHRFEESGGLIVRRNLGAKLASAPYVFSIDDDAEFVSDRTIEQTLPEFHDLRIGAVAIPVLDVNKPGSAARISPNDGAIYVCPSYIGTSHAVRKDLFLQLGGYREFFFHQGEEGDYCLRMLDQGFFVRVGRADTIHHYESPKRDWTRMDLYGRRNDILSAWCNTPLLWLWLQLAGTTFRGLIFGFRVKRPMNMLRGLGMGYRAIFQFWKKRRPVSLSAYRIWREMKTNSGMITIDQVGGR